MLARIASRGPDGEATWKDPAADVWLGHRRLSILDLSVAGVQPMQSQSGRYVISYNGEIYNHREFRPELEGKGIRFRGTSDTETLLGLIETRGLDAALAAANGMFAFGLWDREKRTLHLVRDRLGIKPLIYATLPHGIAFASSLWAIAAIPELDDAIDEAAAADYFRHLAVPAPHTAIRGARKVPPGSMLVWRAGVARMHQWWSIRDAIERGQANPLRGQQAALIDELDDLIIDATRRQRISDVPLGAFLSGGIDSSSVVAGMAQSGGVKTFTIAFPGSANDESKEAELMARHLGAIHTTIEFDQQDVLRLVPELSKIYDEPFGDASALPTLLLCRATRREVTVALSGDGGDELFGGYPRYFFGTQVDQVRRYLGPRGSAVAATMLRSTPPWLANGILANIVPGGGGSEGMTARLQRLALYLSTKPADTYRRAIAVWPDPPILAKDAAEIETGATDISRYSSLGWPERMMAMDQESHLPDDLLTKVDRASMSIGLEVRVPLLDHRIVEWSWRVPRARLLGHQKGAGKPLLRGVLARRVPPHLFERPKRGFGAPLEQWLRGDLKDWAQSFFGDGMLADDGIIDPAPIRVAWDNFASGQGDMRSIWTAIAWLGWRRAWHEVRLQEKAAMRAAC